MKPGLRWTTGFATVTLHSFTGDTLRLYYEPAPGAPHMTGGRDLSALIAALPDLRRHRCDNGRHRDFLSEARDTEMAHLLEHAIIEVLASDGQTPRSQIRGATNLDEAPARYRIKISGFRCATEAGECIEKALRLLES